MASRGDTVFPLIPAPMALALDTLSAASSAQRSPVPSRSTSSAGSTATGNARHPLFNEDIFSRFYATPFMALHLALYGAVPLYYLLHCSPFRDFCPGDAADEAARWCLVVLTQYATAVVVTSWGGRYRVQKDVVACAVLAGLVAGAAWLRASTRGMSAPEA